MSLSRARDWRYIGRDLLVLVSIASTSTHAADPIADVTITTTATQAVIAYTTRHQGACIVAAGEVDDPALISDVNPSLFAGSNSDDRFSQWRRQGGRRLFVLGARTSEESGGVLHSRALAADTQHWVRITCGEATYSGMFSTRTLATGNLHADAPPFNGAGFGNYAWPTIDWTDKTKHYIDPMTGVRFQLMTTVGALGGKGLDKPFGAYKVLSGPEHWRHIGNIASGVIGTLADYSGPGEESVFVAVDPTEFNCPYCRSNGVSGFDPITVIDDLAAHVYGYATGTADSDGDVRICLTLDSGTTCAGRTLTIRLPRGFSEINLGDVPAAFPAREFIGWGRAVRKREMPSFGEVMVSNGVMTVSTDEARSMLMDRYPTGALVQIAGSERACGPAGLCSIRSIDSALRATLNETFSVEGQRPFKMANLGVKVWKATAHGTIRLRLRLDYAYSVQPGTTAGGNDDRCSRNPVTIDYAADGVTRIRPMQGFLCTFPYPAGTDAGAMYLVPLDGEPPRLISLFRPDFMGSPPQDRPRNGTNHPGDWSWTEPATLYEIYATQTAGVSSLFRVRYDAAKCRYKTLDYHYGAGEGGDLPAPDRVSDCMEWTNLTPPSHPGRSIDAQVQALFPEYDTKRWGPFAAGFVGGVTGAYFVGSRSPGGQDSTCYVIAIDLATGTIARGWRMWDGDETSRRRWAGCHSTFGASYPGYAGVAYKQMYSDRKYGGKYEFLIAAIQDARGGWSRADTSLGATIGDGTYNPRCPTDIPDRYKRRGATANNCVTIRINSLVPCRVSSSVDERASSPCGWDAKRATLFGQQLVRGDVFADGASNTSEHLQIVKIIPGPPIEIVALRAMRTRLIGTSTTPGCGDGVFQRNHRAGWVPYMAVKENVCEATDLYLSAATGAEFEDDADVSGSHHDLGAPLTGAPGHVTIVAAGNDGYRVRTGDVTKVGQTHDYLVASHPKFANHSTSVAQNQVQSYASKRTWRAEGDARNWAIDFRHLNGGLGAAPEIPDYSIGNSKIARALQRGTTSVYKFFPLQNAGAVAHNPKLSDTLVWAGYHNFRDKSSAATGDVLTDQDAWHYCYAYRRDECRSGSAAGDFYAVVPGAIDSGTAAGNCYTNQSAKTVLCAASGSPLGGWIVQVDVSKADQTGAGTRKLSMGLSGPGRQYVFNNVRALPDGRRAMFAADWAGGERREYFLMTLPRFVHDSVNRTTFVPVSITVPPRIATRVVAKFGYSEYGRPDAYHATTRQEATVAVGSVMNETNPFLFEHEVGPTSGQTCADGCTVTIPAIGDRVLFYELYANRDGRLVALPDSRTVVVTP